MNAKLTETNPLPWREFEPYDTHCQIMDSAGRIVMKIQAAPQARNARDLAAAVILAANAKHKPAKIANGESKPGEGGDEGDEKKGSDAAAAAKNAGGAKK